MPTFRGKPVFRREASLNDYKKQPGYFPPPQAEPLSDESMKAMKSTKAVAKKAPAKPTN
jgi:hypothetical protein